MAEGRVAAGQERIMRSIPCHVVTGSIADVWIELVWVTHGCVIVGFRSVYMGSQEGLENRSLPSWGCGRLEM